MKSQRVWNTRRRNHCLKDWTITWIMRFTHRTVIRSRERTAAVPALAPERSGSGREIGRIRRVMEDYTLMDYVQGKNIGIDMEVTVKEKEPYEGPILPRRSGIFP